MIDAFTTRRDKIKTLIILVACGLSTIASVVLGIDDNPPGVLLAFLAAVAFILAFCHPWRTARKFTLLLLASVLGFVLFMILSMISDSIVENPASSVTLQKLIQSTANEALNVIFVMLCSAAFVVGIVGTIVMFIRNRQQRKMKV